jgi:hypothetical protein
MTTEIPSTPAVPVDAGEQAAFETMRTDAVLTGRAMSSAEYLRGLLLNGQLATVGEPDKLAADLEPDVDPVAVQRIWDRALAVGLHAGWRYWAPRLHPEELEASRARLAEAGFLAMGHSVARSQGLVARAALVHPADGGIAREHEQ